MMVGIDLGTTYSAVAYVNELGQPEILTNRDGERLTPSVVMFQDQDQEPLVGKMAKHSVAMAPDNAVQFVKRFMGDPAWVHHTQTNEAFRAEEVSALILMRLKEDAEHALDLPVTDAVITVPAYFDDARRKATKDAGQLAGLNVRRLLNEPTAAALAYGLQENDSNHTLLVLDLGGGTFDVTVMQISGGDFNVLATGGDRNLGGYDWDNLTMNWLNEQFISAGGPSLLDEGSLESELREKAESAKRSLTSVASTKVMLGTHGEVETVTLTREIFDDLTATLLSRTRHWTEEVLEDAGLNRRDLDKVLLVGGSTRMPQVRKMVESLTGKTPEHSINPDEVVALGAAVQAHIESTSRDTDDSFLPVLYRQGERIDIKDVTSQSLGTIAQYGINGEPFNSIIISRNTRIPTKGSEIYRTLYENQEEVLIQVTEGDDTDPDYVTILGECIIRLPRYPAGAEIEVAFSYDVDQTIFVEVRDLTSGEQAGSFEVDRVANLSKEELAQSRAKLQQITVA